MAELGNAWLRDYYQLDATLSPLSKECRTGPRRKLAPGDSVAWEYFQKAYAPEPVPLAHVEFALKYDNLNLELLRLVFARIGKDAVGAWVKAQPTGKWARRIGYLYEFLTGENLDPKGLGVGGNYAPLLDSPERYVVAANPVKIKDWRIEDNLLGDRDFCPVVRRTPEIERGEALNLSDRLNDLSNQYPPEIFRRAVRYLYEKETRRSFEIEREQPTPDREARFVAALQDAGKSLSGQILDEQRLVEIQRIIVDPRYAQSSYRATQNYIGETLPNYRQRVHFIPPPPQQVHSLMRGLADFLTKSEGCHPVMRAAVTAFQFVFIHPFDDGNGRLHRFLIQDLLALDHYVPTGVVVPVSAWMLKHMPEYDRCLESFSKPLMDVARWELDAEDRLMLLNPDAVEAKYRYPDLTPQVEYLGQAIDGALTEELVPELNFLSGYDRARDAIRAVVDMPDRRLDSLIKVLHEHRGELSNRKREYFSELTDQEVEKIRAIYQEAFGAQH